MPQTLKNEVLTRLKSAREKRALPVQSAVSVLHVPTRRIAVMAKMRGVNSSHTTKTEEGREEGKRGRKEREGGKGREGRGGGRDGRAGGERGVNKRRTSESATLSFDV